MVVLFFGGQFVNGVSAIWLFCFFRLDWIGLDGLGLAWLGVDWMGLDWVGLDWIELN